MKRDRFTAGEYLPLVAVMLLCVCVGSVSLPLGNTLTALWRGLWGRPLPEGVPKAILFSVRLPRVLCVALTGLTPLRHASALTLSGGELQRAFLAQVFAQDPRVLVLDEPANHLDLKYQQHIFGLIAAWRQRENRAVLSVVHDLSLARRYGTGVLLLHRGKCVAKGDMDQALSPQRLREVYEMDVYGWMRELMTPWAREGTKAE